MPPVEYFKHVILEIQNESGVIPVQQTIQSAIRALQKRFEEVIYLIIISFIYI